MHPQVTKWSLEDLELHLLVGARSSSSSSASEVIYLVEGLILQGAEWSAASTGAVEGSLRLSDHLNTPLPISRLQWERKGSLGSTATSGSGGGSSVLLPLYLNKGRKQLIAQVLLPVVAGMDHVDSHLFAQHGTAVVIQSHAD